MTNQSGEQTAEQPLDVLAEQYRAELKRLNYGRATINVYLPTIRRLGQLSGRHGLPLDQLTPDIAAELVLRADWHGDRRQYAIFIVRRFVGYLTTLGLAKPPMPSTARELARAALRRDYESQGGHGLKALVRLASSRAVPARQRRGGSTSRSGHPELDRADLKLRNLLAG